MSVLSYCLSLSGFGLFAEDPGPDSDGDGISDVWEDVHGLDSANPADALQDADGDRIPNLVEYLRGQTDPENPQMRPAADAIVDGELPTDAAEMRFASMQEAYDALPTGGDGFWIVEVKAGKYLQGVDGSAVPKRVAWIASGKGATTLRGGGIYTTDETVIDGFTFISSGTKDPVAVQIKPHVDLAGTVPEVRVVNCIIAGRISGDAAGAVINEGANLSLVHSTLVGNVGQEADGVLNRSGGLNVMNSVVWNARSGDLKDVVDHPVEATISNSLLRGSEGSWGSDPKLSITGHLTKDSLTCLQRGVLRPGSPLDIHHAQRPKGQAPDLGAEQWVDTDHDGLPDWWEIEHFGDLSKDGESAAGRGLTLAQAFRLGIMPDASLLARAGSGKTPSVKITFPPDGSVVR